jgi:uncharacterized membrane protein
MTPRPTGAQPLATRPRASRYGQWPLVLLIVLAFALRVYDLGRRDLWFDEALSANISGLGWEGVVTHLRTEPFEHPPLYFLSLYPWQQLAGTSEFAFRFYSVLWGVFFVPLLYVLVKRLTARRSEHLARLAALLATLSPFLVAYSQEARMYTLLPCLALLVLLSFVNALDREGQPGWWLVYVVLIAVGVATHYYFALTWVTNSIYLLLDSLRYRRVRGWGIAVQALSLLAATVWLVAAPGLRGSLARIWQGETAFSLTYKLGKVMPTLVLAEVGGGVIPLKAHILATGGWMLVLLGVWWSRRGQLLTARAWRLLVLFLVVPLAASLLIPYGVLGRHLGYTLIALLIFMALGLLALRHRGRPWLAVGILAFLLFSTYGLSTLYSLSSSSFGQAMAYINERGQPRDLVVLSQPGQRPLATYYNDDKWPILYLPPGTVPFTPAELEDALHIISETRSRLWLGPIGAWTADPELQVEQWLTAHTFQAEKTWFPDSSSLALYFTRDEDLSALDLDRLVWGRRIRLASLQASPLQVAPGDALRLRFDWQAGLDLDERYGIRLSLTDDKGLTWAERYSEPCGGWCPTDTWEARHLRQDQHALQIPPGTPPGTYGLQVAWLPLRGGPALQAEEDGQRVEQVTVARVTVSPRRGEGGEPWTVPNPRQATFGGEITLLGYQPDTVEIRVGEMLRLETHWHARIAPADPHILLMELLDWKRQVVATWESTPSAHAYPTDMWQAGEYLRGKHDLHMPGNLRPGRYRLRIALLSPAGQRLPLTGEAPGKILSGLQTWQARLKGQTVTLTSIRILDRERQFHLPTITYPLRATVGRQASLMGYDLDLSRAHPGGQLNLTLHWQANGPMVRPFKVFTHLVDDHNKVWAQHDAPPGGGCCPANTWAEGEVIMDEHPITLDADLPPGTYYLVTGMYDEGTASRLPAYDADGNKLPLDRVQIRTVTIQSGSATTPTGPLLDFDHVLHVPLLHRWEP